MGKQIYQLYLELLEKHGLPVKFWPQWCRRKKSLTDREKIAIGAILTQRTSWHNAELALINLKKIWRIILITVFCKISLKKVYLKMLKSIKTFMR